MPTVFNPLSFLRRVPNPLLARYFSSFAAFSGFNWSEISERHIEPVLDRCNAMPMAEREKVFRAFRKVESLANSLGTQVLIEAARDDDLEITQAIRAKKNAYERALWCHIEHPKVFESARTLAHIDALPKRSWETRKNLAQRSIDVAPEMLEELGRRISEYFWTTQCRGDKCKVEHRRREGGVDCFFAYPADYPDESFGYDDEGHFERRDWNPAFEVVFGYHQQDGTTDIFAQGGKRVRDVLSQIFGRVVLGVEQETESAQQDCFNLELFKNPNITFPTNPADNINSVRVNAMRLQFHGRSGGRITVAIDGRSKSGSVYEVIADKLADRHAHLRDATVLGVTLQAFLRTAEGKERGLTFRLSAPSFCDLEDSTEEQVLRRYLREWKIEIDANHVATAA